ncbi:F0F1 ATP synthase subunit B [Bacteroidota bacterium]
MDLVTPGFGMIFWSTITFLVVLLILSKFVWKPIIGALKTREASIEDALQAAELAREEMEKLTADNEKLMAEARAEREQVLKEATKIANRMKDEAKTEATKAGDKMVEEARLTINTEKQAAIREIKNQVADLSLQISERLLKKNLSKDKDQRKLIKEYIKDLKLN